MLNARRLVADIPPEDREHLRGKIFTGLAAVGYAVRLRPEAEITGDCSVAGSFSEGPPPTINVVQAASAGRQYFTALHEYGHCLIVADTAIHDVLFDESDQGVRLTEDICDAIAAELLLPDGVVSECIGPEGPTARGVLELFQRTDASREACCVRAAQRIPGVGHVMLVRNGVAQFTASRGTPYRVRRGTPQDDDHITAKAARRGGSAQEEASVRYASGAQSERFFADAAASDDGYIVGVFIEGRPPWLQGVTLYSGDRAAAAEAYCDRCEEDFSTLAAPCRTCGGYRHLQGCGHCSCGPTPVRNQLCSECFVRRPLAEFSSPRTQICDVCTCG